MKDSTQFSDVTNEQGEMQPLGKNTKRNHESVDDLSESELIVGKIRNKKRPLRSADNKKNKKDIAGDESNQRENDNNKTKTVSDNHGGDDTDDEWVLPKNKKKKSLRKNSTGNLENESKLIEIPNNTIVKYFFKIEKTTVVQTEIRDENIIKVKALVHSPPKLNRLSDPFVPPLFSEPIGQSKRLVFSPLDSIKVLNDDLVEDLKINAASVSSPNFNIGEKNMEKKKRKSSKISLGESAHSENTCIVSKLDKSLGKEELLVNILDATQDKFTNHSRSKLITPKLAPLFLKRSVTEKSKDLPVNKGKEAFLKSGLPQSLIKNNTKLQKPESLQHEEYTFPRVTHVRQLVSPSQNVTQFQNIPMRTTSMDITEHKRNEMFNVTDLSYTDMYDTLEIHKDISDILSHISDLNKKQPNFGVRDHYGRIKEINDKHKFNTDLVWTEKYKPTCSDDIIGNKKNIKLLREWIDGHRNRRIRYSEEGYNSEDDFICSGDSDSSEVINNVAVITGPTGCGKTCTVYALAEELGFKVLEINCGINRSGKHILNELLEATQSHQIKQKKQEKREVKKRKSTKKKHAKTLQNKTMSLILIEDGDVILDGHDEGFVSAVRCLISKSKRPIIFTANNKTISSISKLHNSQKLMLDFKYPSKSHIGTWLKLIALAEGIDLSNYIERNLNLYGCDVRKNLLQLQMIACTNKIRLRVPFSFDNLMIKSIENTNRSNLDQFSKISDGLSKLDYISSGTLPNFLSNNEGYTKNEENSHWISDFRNDLLTQFNKTIVDICEKKTNYGEFLELLERKRNVERVTQNIVSNFGSKLYIDRINSCDYMPTIRSIARCEGNRLSGVMRRTSRFFNYLKSVNIFVNDYDTKFLCDSLV